MKPLAEAFHLRRFTRQAVQEVLSRTVLNNASLVGCSGDTFCGLGSDRKL